MTIPSLFFKTNANNLTPLTRTPWAGEAIANIKRRYHPQQPWPHAVGESWEISTDAQFPSHISAEVTLTTLLAQRGDAILGRRFSTDFGSSCPILLKWIEAAAVLSVQVHPTHSHPALSPAECGKPESWLVLQTQPGAKLYLGFREGVTRQQAENLAHTEKFTELLQEITPQPYDYFYIPPGCVHALGPDLLVAEPQLILPGKSGKTWRLNDWNRRYNKEGVLSPEGEPRELHVEAALSAIDWTLPTGDALVRRLKRNLLQPTNPEQLCNPFPAQLLTSAGKSVLAPSAEPAFRLITVWGGKVTLECPKQGGMLELVGGESAIIAAEAHNVELTLERHREDSPAAAIFELSPEADLWRS